MCKERGLTILELWVVLALVALMVRSVIVFVGPQLYIASSVAEAEKITASLQRTRQLAITQMQRFRVVFGPNSYAIERFDGWGNYALFEGPFTYNPGVTVNATADPIFNFRGFLDFHSLITITIDTDDIHHYTTRPKTITINTLGIIKS